MAAAVQNVQYLELCVRALARMKFIAVNVEQERMVTLWQGTEQIVQRLGSEIIARINVEQVRCVLRFRASLDVLDHILDGGSGFSKAGRCGHVVDSWIIQCLHKC